MNLTSSSTAAWRRLHQLGPLRHLRQLQERWRNTSFGHRLIGVITGLHLLLMGVVVIDLVWRQHFFLHDQALQHANGLARTLAVSSSSWVMAHDVAGLQEVVESVASNAHVRYVMVLSPNGQVLAHSDRRWQGSYVTDAISEQLLNAAPSTQTLLHGSDLDDVAAPIMTNTQLLAWARVGMDQEHIHSNLHDLVLRSLGYVALGTLLAYVLARLTTRWLVRGLQRLATGFERAGRGERGFRLEQLHNDEVGHLGQRFNALLGDLENNEAQLRALATTDFLTGLANRRSFMEKIQYELARMQRVPDQSVTVLMLDLDHFKRVNDTYGHATGDEVLRHVAQLMRQCVRKTDVCVRLGGEEFAILLPHTSLSSAQVLAERLRSAIARAPLQIPQAAQMPQQVDITISIGMSALHPTDALPDQALARADQALYRAKALGRNRVECYLDLENEPL